MKHGSAYGRAGRAPARVLRGKDARGRLLFSWRLTRGLTDVPVGASLLWGTGQGTVALAQQLAHPSHLSQPRCCLLPCSSPCDPPAPTASCGADTALKHSRKSSTCCYLSGFQLPGTVPSCWQPWSLARASPPGSIPGSEPGAARVLPRL